MSKSKEMVIILTGASRGIGLATAHHLLTHPTQPNLLLIARTHSALDAIHFQYGSARVEVLAGDISDPKIGREAVARARDRWGRLDAVVVNHGTLEPVKRVAETSVEEWAGAVGVNVLGAVGVIQPSIPLLRASHGRILLTSSGASITPYISWGPYGACKAALNHLALTLSVEEPLITTIAIRPGVVDTEMQREIREVHAGAMSDKDREKFARLKREGGLLRPEQPGRVIAELAVGEGVGGGGALSGRFLSWDDEVLGRWQGES